MPTPFMHLAVAEEIRKDPRLPPAVRRTIEQAWPAFYLGHIAPDLQAIHDMPREATHFYRLPPDPNHRAEEALLAAHPLLATPERLAAEHAVFVAAYQAHLMLDLIWYRQVLMRHFIDVDIDMDFRQRFVIHNTLLTYLDQQALASLPEEAGESLAAARPHNWLPFATDEQLRTWRDTVARQLEPGTPIRTVEIYAERLAMTPDAFAANLAQPAWLEANVFTMAPIAEVTAVLNDSIGEAVDLIAGYLQTVE